MAARKGLGRGLDLLIPKEDHSLKNSEEKKETRQEIKSETEQKVNINEIEPNKNQPRKQFDEDAIDELADSIRQYGVIQPLIVQKKDNYYEIIAGERRWRACKKAGIKEVPVIIKNYDEKDRLKISLIENLQRENLNPIEEAKAYQKLQEEYGLKQDEIALSVSKSRTAITNIMRLLKLDERVQNMVMENIISSGHGRTLLPIEDGDLQYQIAEKILDENLSVRESEKLVKAILSKSGEKPKKEEKTSTSQEKEMIHFFEEKMKNIFGSKVVIKNNKNNKGKIEIDYYSKEELERIIDLIQTINI
ncbi:MAG: ParB/RepB/Spo0J family partition protein [Anaerobutyricum sp.]|nr:ParB/RepB/Spo0J family partition protein [Anaerobutyricum sp.]